MKLYQIIITISILICAGLPLSGHAEEIDRKPLKSASGKIIDTRSREEIPFASIFFPEQASGIMSNVDGAFSFPFKPGEKIRMQISYLGYQTLDTIVAPTPSSPIIIALIPQDLSLNEVVVSAKENVKGNSVSWIGKTALEHIQPSSFSDVLQLLPGGMTKDSNLASANYIALRQAGSDQNTSLGTAFLINGVQLSNDNNLQDVRGKDSNNTYNGIDMRTISTDRIESVEIIRGIPSVQYGDLTAGVVKIELKGGHTPWEARIKTDLKNKLFSVGKGVVLPKKKGLLNVDFDYADFRPDPRSEIQDYTRYTFSGRYENKINLSEKVNYLIKANMSYTGSFDSKKKDPDVLKGKDDYSKESYNSYLFSTNGKFQFTKSFVNELFYNLSANYINQQSEVRKVVAPSGVTIVPTATSEGAYDARFLAGEYTSYLTVDGAPLSLSAQIHAKSLVEWGKWKQNFLLGSELRYDKNLGKGEIYDLNYPPYPDGKSTRPRPFNDVPALQKASFYIEDDIRFRTDEWCFSAQPGLRTNTLIGMDPRYAMNGKFYWEPRINAKLTFPEFKLFDKTSTFALTGGSGRMYKFPTQGQLYPTDIYFDYIQLNYYSQNEALRALNVFTRIESPVNYELVPALNIKNEVGFILNIGKTRLDFSVFHEKMDNGFSSASRLAFHTYTDYDESSVDPKAITTKPQLNDFSSAPDTMIAVFGGARNLLSVTKRGIEYTLNIGKIPAIYTNLSINGAWFETTYKDNGQTYSVPNVVINGKRYPYAGVYSYGTNDNTKSQLNTNFNFDTHIPDLRMIFTTSLQTMWYEQSQREWNDGLPDTYIDKNGINHTFTPEMVNDPFMRHLTDTHNDYIFKKGKIPIASYLNLKMTKEIGQHLRLSFYVNRILSYLPEYTSIFGKKVNRADSGSAQSYFGAEISFSIN